MSGIAIPEPFLPSDRPAPHVAHELGPLHVVLAEERDRVHDERERIATDLHEHVLHRLFSSGLTLHSAAATLRVLPARSPETRTVIAQIQGTIDELDRTTTQIRDTIFQLQDLGATGRRSLHDRLAEAAADLTPALGFAPQLRLDSDLDEAVPPDLDDGLVAVLRAALANVAAYARAGAVQIDLSVRRSWLVVAVSDDGEDIGVDGADMNPTRRAGLVSLTHWARHHHGSVEVTPVVPNGTILSWAAPLPGAPPLRDAALP